MKKKILPDILLMNKFVVNCFLLKARFEAQHLLCQCKPEKRLLQFEYFSPQFAGYPAMFCPHKADGIHGAKAAGADTFFAKHS